jgi:hypothetical protein
MFFGKKEKIFWQLAKRQPLRVKMRVAWSCASGIRRAVSSFPRPGEHY